MDQCGACGADFSSVVLFDQHRVGRHELDYPEHKNGRRCLSEAEMIGRGWTRNQRGRWVDPKAAQRTREAFGVAA